MTSLNGPLATLSAQPVSMPSRQAQGPRSEDRGFQTAFDAANQSAATAQKAHPPAAKTPDDDDEDQASVAKMGQTEIPDQPAADASSGRGVSEMPLPDAGQGLGVPELGTAIADTAQHEAEADPRAAGFVDLATPDPGRAFDPVRPSAQRADPATTMVRVVRATEALAAPKTVGAGGAADPHAVSGMVAGQAEPPSPQAALTGVKDGLVGGPPTPDAGDLAQTDDPIDRRRALRRDAQSDAIHTNTDVRRKQTTSGGVPTPATPASTPVGHSGSPTQSFDGLWADRLGQDGQSLVLGDTDGPAQAALVPGASGATSSGPAAVGALALRMGADGAPVISTPQMTALAKMSVAAMPGGVELRLSPEELGSLRMSLGLDGDIVRVTITADRPETLDLMRRHAADLAAEFRSLGYEGAAFAFQQGGSDADPQAQAEQTNTDLRGTQDAQPAAFIAQRQAGGATATGLDIRL